MNGEGVNAAGQFRRKRLIDQAVAVEPAFRTKGFRHDMDAEVRFAALPVAGMARVLVRFVLDLEAERRERLSQPLGDRLLHAHDVGLEPVFAAVNAASGLPPAPRIDRIVP